MLKTTLVPEKAYWTRFLLLIRYISVSYLGVSYLHDFETKRSTSEIICGDEHESGTTRLKLSVYKIPGCLYISSEGSGILFNLYMTKMVIQFIHLILVYSSKSSIQWIAFLLANRRH